MSYGKLCGAVIKASDSINSNNNITLSCGLYDNHTGNHSCTIYHCHKVGRNDPVRNFRIGSVEWSDEFSQVKNTST